MKRVLLESRKVLPYTAGQVIDRATALSGVVGINISAADTDAVATITLSHADEEGGAFEAVLDERLFLNQSQLERDSAGQITQVYISQPVAAGELYNIDFDLLGCKRYIRVDVEYSGSATASYALALGDHTVDPPQI